MRTGIYVHKPTTISLHAKDPNDRFRVFSYDPAHAIRAGEGKQHLEPGIYLVHSTGAVDVKGGDLTVVIVMADKDPWPDPKVNVIALERGASSESIRAFFQVAKDASVDVVDPKVDG